MKLKNTNTTQPETLIFDFGNVLLDIDINRTIKAWQQLGINPPEAGEIFPDNSGIFLELEVGNASTEDFADDLRRRAKNPQLETQQIIDAWNDLLLPFEWGRFKLIRQLKKSYRVVLLSNTNQPHHEWFEARFAEQNPWGIRFVDLFDHIFYSDQMGMRKPNREIYQTVQSELGSAPETLWFVDDNAPNLVEPSALGWQTHHLTPNERIEELFVAK